MNSSEAYTGKKFPFPFTFRLRNRFRQRFFISYILILIIPLVAFPLIYRYSYNMLRDKEQELRSLLLTECSANMDDAIRQIDDTMLSLEQNTGLKTLLYLKQKQSYGSPDVWDIYKAQKEMSTLLTYADFDYDLSLYIDRADLVFDGSTFTYGKETFYDIHTSFAGMDYSDFEQQVLTPWHAQDVMSNMQLVYKKNTTKEGLYTKKDGILYLISLPIISGSSLNHLGTAAVHISTELLDSLDYLPVSSHGCTFILDQKSSLIYGVFGSDYTGDIPQVAMDGLSGSYMADIQGRTSVVTYVVSPYNGWQYISVSPMNELASSLFRLRNMFLLGLFCVLLIGLLLCFRFTDNNAAPLESILQTLRESSSLAVPEINSFTSLEMHLKHMIQDNSDLSAALEEQRIKLSNTFYEQLLGGGFSTAEELTANANYLGIHLDAGMYGFLVLSFEDALSTTEETALTSANMAQLFAQYLTLPQLSFRTQTHILSMNRLGILLFFQESDPIRNRELLREEFEPKLAEMQEQYSGDIHCCCGKLYTTPDNLSLSCTEALSALRQTATKPQEEGICFYDALETASDGYFYPAALETKLKALVEAGNTEGTDQLLDYIFSENLEKRSLTLRMLEAFFMDMQTGIIRTLLELDRVIPLSGLFHLHANTLDVHKECGRIRNSYHQIIEELTSHPSGSEDVSSQFLSYLEENFSDSLMCVSTAAEHFHMSDSYFSAYFKKNTGHTFGKYLETLRINKACELLRTTSLTIEEVSERTGYASSLSFRRAFKKVMGVPPSAYR